MHVCYRCGLCRPPREPYLTCPECNALNDPERGQFGQCYKCGATLPPRQLPTPVHCRQVDAMCANPCGKAEKQPREASTGKCIYHTPITL
jgi:hypothetical protein